MARPKLKATRTYRLPLSEARKLNAIAKHLGISFRDAFIRLAGKDIDRLYARMKAGEKVELGESGA